MSASGVRVFFACLDLPEPRLRELRASLQAEERARAERFVLERHRSRFTAARGLLREALASELGVAAQAVRFEYGHRGKPRVASGLQQDLRFNVSHSQDLSVFAIARGLELGVDVEAVRADIEHAAIASRFFSPAERAALLGLPEPERAAAFFKIWTRKEAYIKLLGGGLAIPLDSFDITRDIDEPVEIISLDAPPGFVAALAVAAAGAISQL